MNEVDIIMDKLEVLKPVIEDSPAIKTAKAKGFGNYNKVKTLM